MARRVHVPHVAPGRLTLDERNAHHLRDVLRVRQGDGVEVFDAEGRVAAGTVVEVSSEAVRVEVGDVSTGARQAVELTVAAAVPKGNRADWMIEKLSELGTSHFIPLRTDRSVVHPEGAGKLDRWHRLAEESAKQSRRTGVMQIHDLMPLDRAVAQARADGGRGYCLAPGAGGSLLDVLGELPAGSRLTSFVGPEGGWTEAELSMFEREGIARVSLGRTVLRIETAALAAAVILGVAGGPAGARLPDES
jgi:16S rRNA (uracil1498-N3)-methyltransferase